MADNTLNNFSASLINEINSISENLSLEERRLAIDRYDIFMSNLLDEDMHPWELITYRRLFYEAFGQMPPETLKPEKSSKKKR
jgi:hypothetical protein